MERADGDDTSQSQKKKNEKGDPEEPPTFVMSKTIQQLNPLIDNSLFSLLASATSPSPLQISKYFISFESEHALTLRMRLPSCHSSIFSVGVSLLAMVLCFYNVCETFATARTSAPSTNMDCMIAVATTSALSKKFPKSFIS